jgi:hypothetical protein
MRAPRAHVHLRVHVIRCFSGYRYFLVPASAAAFCGSRLSIVLRANALAMPSTGRESIGQFLEPACH